MSTNSGIREIEQKVAHLRAKIADRGISHNIGDALYQAECELVIAKMAARVWTAENIIKRMST